MGRLLLPVTLVAAALVLATAAGATPPTPIGGYEAITGGTATVTRVADGNTFVANHLTGTIGGSFTGTFTADYTAIVHPSGATNIVGGTFVCTCSFEGRTGTLTFRFTGSGTAAGVTEIQAESIGGTGGLANLHSNLGGQVVGAAVTYAGTAHFDP